MNKKILTPLRSYNEERVYYIYKEYLHMFKKHDFDVIAIGNISDETLDFLCSCCDGLLLSGGKDLDPKLYNQSLNPKTQKEVLELEQLEMRLIKKFVKLDKPIIGICRGLQSINVALGGTLIQDILETNKYKNHLQEQFSDYHHLIITKENTLINKYLGSNFMANSFHHQAIDQVAPGFTISAYSSDGIIEAIEKDNIIALQWHPEKINDKTQDQIMHLFKSLFDQ